MLCLQHSYLPSLSFAFTPSASPSFPLPSSSVCSRISPPLVFPSFPPVSLTAPVCVSPPLSCPGHHQHKEEQWCLSKCVNVYGPAGTGKTVFAKVGKWDENLSTAVRRGGRKGGSVCLFLLLFRFLLLRHFLLLLLTSSSSPPSLYLLLSPFHLSLPLPHSCFIPSLRVLLVTLVWTMLS